ncbi:MAG: hypothetical protein U0166_16465 [Acidobacteriota bacterium]
MLASVIPLLWAGNGAASSLPHAATATPLSRDARVQYRRAVEEVYWRHRIWPSGNPGARPPLSAVLPDEAIAGRVDDDLRKSEALDAIWHRPITGAQLQAEMDRMARETKDPVVLAELFHALHDDPAIVAECLARPLLADRLVRALYAEDARIHGALRARAEAEASEARRLGDLRALAGYQETEWTLANGAGDIARSRPGDPIALDRASWDDLLVRLERDDEGAPLREAPDQFYVTAVLSRGETRVRVATVEWAKRPFDDWWREVRDGLEPCVPIQGHGCHLPAISGTASGAPDTWTSTFVGVPIGRQGHTAVWTGSEMIVWGGGDGNYPPVSTPTGGRYDPATDTWANGGTSLTNVAGARSLHTAVWTGTEMIVWGGINNLDTDVTTGGRYNPASDTWVATSEINVPMRRERHTAVWTGTEMIVWGGRKRGAVGSLQTGGRYDPATDTWVAAGTSVANAPTPRDGHTAIWTGSEMIVWGGTDAGAPPCGICPPGTGGRYDPTTDTWVATAQAFAPTERRGHRAVWTGSKMVVWGGGSSTGGRYDATSDTWASLSTTGAPAGNVDHTAVWTGSAMVVWGGNDGTSGVMTGGRYDPAGDVWSATSTVNAPSPRFAHSAVWTGSEMIVWGGFDTSAFDYATTGGRYDPAADSWASGGTGVADILVARSEHTGVWTGSEMIVWGGDAPRPSNTGSRYVPATDAWTTTSTLGAPAARDVQTAVWTGTEMIVWGGYDGASNVSTGGRYDPAVDAWQATAVGGAPPGRVSHTAVWTGTEMVIWGGQTSGGETATGGRYDPSADAWVPGGTAMANAPSPRSQHTAVWTGSDMIVWGGYDGSANVATGGRYSPSNDSWAAGGTAAAGAPSARVRHSAVWTGARMVIWGGFDGSCSSTGARYDPASDTWAATSPVNAPTARLRHSAVMAGSEMIVWSGLDCAALTPKTGGQYNLVTDSWAAGGTSTVNAPRGRYAHSAIWTGRRMIVWGGLDGSIANTGGLYSPFHPAVDHVVGEGLGDTNGNGVRVFDGAGAPTPVAFSAYGAGKWGTNVFASDLDADASGEIVTGPGPGPVYGPQVRAFRRDGTAIAKINYYAYGTLKYGANVAGGDVDRDARDEILSGAGPGVVFGPHVRGWNYDGIALGAIQKISFFAYGTLQYGVNVASGDVDSDLYTEILTGPGPGPVFSSQVRGFDYDGANLAAIAKINFNAFALPGFGVDGAGGDVDGDGFDEIACAPGPGPTHPSRFLGFNYDGGAISALAGFDVTPYATTFGGRVGAGDVSADGFLDLLTGAGRDPAASSQVDGFSYASGGLVPLPGSFTPFTGGYGVNVTAGALGY